MFGVLLSILQTSGAGPVNPFYTGKVPAYSDTFLALTLVAALAMIAALRLRSARATLPSTGAR